MTYPQSGFTNQWGPAALASSFSYSAPIGSGVPAPPANVAQTAPTPPSSDPSGKLNTQLYLSTMVDGVQQGTPALNVTSQVVLAGVPAGELAVNNWYAGSSNGPGEGTPGTKFTLVDRYDTRVARIRAARRSYTPSPAKN